MNLKIESSVLELPGIFECVFVSKFYHPLNLGEIIQSFSKPHHLSTIPLKDSHLFKITESVINFCFKKISNSTILNR